MPWCPCCGTEYRQGFDACSECSVRLVDTPPLDDSPPVYNHHGGWTLLVNVYDSREAEMLKTWLESEGIPVLLQPRGPAGDYMGVYLGNAFHVDVYVPEEVLEAARAMIISPPPIDVGPIATESVDTTQTAVGKSLIVWIFFIPLFVGLIILLLQRFLK